MKKIALLLALVMTLGVASMASAAEVTVGGEVEYNVFTSGGLFVSGIDSAKLTVKAVVSDQVTANLRVNGIASGDTYLANAPRIDRANIVISNFGLPVSVTLGKAFSAPDLFGVYGIGYSVGVKTNSFNGFTAQVLGVGPAGSDVYTFGAANFDYTADFGAFGLDLIKNGTKTDISADAKVAIPNTPVSALLQFRRDGVSEKNDIYAGAEANVAGLTLTGKYMMREIVDPDYGTNDSIIVSAEKELDGTTYSLEVEKVENFDDLGITAAVKVAF